jgi:general secretion pathway protein M
MKPKHPLDHYLTRYSSVAASLYFVVVVALTATVLFASSDVVERYRAVGASAEVLARLEKRTPLLSSDSDWTEGAVPAGSPFLDGETVTTASAALLQQVTASITGAGGKVISSEVAPRGERPVGGTRGERSGDAFVRIIANCELDEGALLHLLYDIEARMPFLFIDQFVAEAPANEAGKMHILLGVSGIWVGNGDVL